MLPQVADVKLDTAMAIGESDFGPLLMKWGFVASDASIAEGEDSLVGLKILTMSLGYDICGITIDSWVSRKYVFICKFKALQFPSSYVRQEVTEQIKLLSKKMQAMQEQLANLVAVAGNKSDK